MPTTFQNWAWWTHDPEVWFLWSLVACAKEKRRVLSYSPPPLWGCSDFLQLREVLPNQPLNYYCMNFQKYSEGTHLLSMASSTQVLSTPLGVHKVHRKHLSETVVYSMPFVGNQPNRANNLCSRSSLHPNHSNGCHDNKKKTSSHVHIPNKLNRPSYH